VVKLDLGASGDGDGTKATDWNTLTSGTGSIAGGSVIRHGDAQAIPGLSITGSLPNGGNTGQDNNSAAAGWSGMGADPYYNSESYTDLVWSWGQSPNQLRFTFGGLDNTLVYNVRAYSLIDEGLANFDVTVTDGAGTQTSTNLNRTTLYNTAPLDSSLLFTGLSTDGSGNIAVTVEAASAGVSFEAIVLEAIAP
jgi:hypothetical protein